MLPKVVYVYEEQERDGTTYLVASKSPDCEDGSLLGVYTLTEKLHVRSQTQLRRENTKTWFAASKR